MGFSQNGRFIAFICFLMQQPFEIDDLGVPPFWKTSRYLWQVHTSTIYIRDCRRIPYTVYPITSHSITVVGIIKELQMGDELWI